MASGEVDVVIVGADRIAANGDTANKVGTYHAGRARGPPRDPVLHRRPDQHGRSRDARRRGHPDRGAQGRARSSQFRGVRIAPPDTAVRNPSFDVTPAELITRDRHRGGRGPRARTRTGLARDAVAQPRADAPRPRRPARVRPTVGRPPDGLGRAGRGGRRPSARVTTDRALLRAFLEQDRLFAAYAICDLEEREFARTRWGAACDGRRARSRVGPRIHRPDARSRCS